MNTTNIVPRLRAAIAARRPTALRQVIDDHGLVVFSNALAACSPRVATDALSLLLPAQCNAVLRHMPSARRADPFTALLASLDVARPTAGASA